MCKNNTDYPLYQIPFVSDFHDLIRQKAEVFPNGIAFAWYEKGRKKTVSYKQFYNNCRNTARILLKEGYHKHNIAILEANTYEWLQMFAAIILSGNTAVPLDIGMTKEERIDVFFRMDIRLILTSMDLEEKQEIVERGIDIYPIGNFCKQVSETTLDYYVLPEIKRNDVACIFLTSGTTGLRKGVMLSHANLAEDIYQSCRMFVLEGNTLAILPFFHAFGLIVAVWMVYHYGYTVYISQGLRYVRKELGLVRPQTMMLVPLFVETFYRQIVLKTKKEIDSEIVRAVGRAFFGGRLEYIICGGAPLDKTYVQNYRQFGVEILNGYGTTECAPVAAVNRNCYHKDGTVGLAIPNSKIVISELGEVLISGRHVMCGYYNEPKETELALRDGWYHTGDLGMIDEQGFLTLTGRVKNLIILSNGENISPEELEKRLQRIKGITEVIVSSEGHLLIAEVYAKGARESNQAAIMSEIQKINRTWPMYKRINKVVFREKPFEKTTTQKIVRKEKHA